MAWAIKCGGATYIASGAYRGCPPGDVEHRLPLGVDDLWHGVSDWLRHLCLGARVGWG